MSLNYSEEVEKLSEASDWFNPKAGQHKVKFLSELSEPYTQDFEGQPRFKVKARVEVNGKELQWSMNVGETRASLYGQLVLCGQKFGVLTDEVISLVVTSDGKKRTFAVLEAFEETEA